ncbi:hypothetical protein B0H13DRAFT_2399006 [Mycena leptocephala]|nr:hypothetical protein B0H13DRAFT_2399006 [Mycena leptocephala]
MSSFNVFGFFALTAGKRVATQPPGATYPIHHNHYTTSLKSSSEIYVAATLRIYSGAGDAPVPDNTIAFVVAKAFAAIGKPVELEALYMSAMPGDVNRDEYEAGSWEAVPECPIFIYGVGHIPQNQTAQVLADNTKVFTVTTSDYIGGSPKNSTVQCVYPATRRWANVPVPRAQSCTQFLGICDGFADSGLLRVAIEHITLSLGPQILSQSGTDPVSNTNSPTTPTKRKKYVAVGLTSTPTTETTPMAVTGMGANTTSDAFIGPPSSSHAVAGPGPSTTSAHETRSRKRRAPSGSPSPLPDDHDTDVGEETPVKSKGKKKARQ